MVCAGVLVIRYRKEDNHTAEGMATILVVGAIFVGVLAKVGVAWYICLVVAVVG